MMAQTTVAVISRRVEGNISAVLIVCYATQDPKAHTKVSILVL